MGTFQFVVKFNRCNLNWFLFHILLSVQNVKLLFITYSKNNRPIRVVIYMQTVFNTVPPPFQSTGPIFLQLMYFLRNNLWLKMHLLSMTSSLGQKFSLLKVYTDERQSSTKIRTIEQLGENGQLVFNFQPSYEWQLDGMHCPVGSRQNTYFKWLFGLILGVCSPLLCQEINRYYTSHIPKE